MCKLSCAVITVNFIGDCITVAMAHNLPQMFACELFYDFVFIQNRFSSISYDLCHYFCPFLFFLFIYLFLLLYFTIYFRCFLNFYVYFFEMVFFFIFIHLKLYLLLFWLVRMRRQGSGSRHHVGGGSVLRCEGVRNKHENLKTKHCFMHTRVVTSN